MADQLIVNKVELFSVGIDGNNKAKISGLIDNGADVTSYRIAEDSQTVVFQTSELGKELNSVFVHIFAYREHGILRSVNTYFYQP